MAETKTVSVNAGGFLTTGLTLLFAAAKIFVPERFPYSWWVVFAPIWIPLALVLAVGILVFAGIVVKSLWDHWQAKRRRKQHIKDNPELAAKIAQIKQAQQRRRNA